MKRLLSIKEFSDISGIETTTLRYWDDIGLFSPAMRNPETNYRYYSTPQLIPLNFITVLSDIDVSLKTIGELANERDPEAFIQLIDHQEKLLNMEMRKLRVSYAIIHARRELISYGLRVENADKITVMTKEETPLIIGPRNVYEEGETFKDALASLVKKAKEMRMNLSYPVGGYHESLESFISRPDQPDHFFSLDPTGTSLINSGDYVVGYTSGDYGEFGDLPERIAAYLKESNLKPSGPVYTQYLLDEICIKNPSQYLAQSFVSTMKKRKSR